MQERQATRAAEDYQTVSISSVDPYHTLEALRTFEKRHAERDITQRVYRFVHGGNDYAISSNGWSMLAVRTHMISAMAASGLRALPESYIETFRNYFAPVTEHKALHARLKDLRAWCGGPKFRQCTSCEQNVDVVRHAGSLFGRAVDRNLIAMSVAFGDEDAQVSIYPAWEGGLTPIVFRHEHFLAVVMPMREVADDLPKYPEQNA